MRTIFLRNFIISACALALAARAADSDTLRDLGTNAASGEIPKWDGSQWRAAHDDITTVIAGPGVLTAGTNKTVTVSVNFTASPTNPAVASLLEVDATRPPIGAVVAWMKTFENTPTNLPPGWVECNGQVLNDTNSLYHGRAIANLNGVSGVQPRFLRGATTSGTTGGTQTHSHISTSTRYSSGNHGVGANTEFGSSGTAEVGMSNPTYTASGERLLTSTTDTLPSYYEVVWIMRVK